MKLALIFALVAVASVVGIANYNKERGGGGNTVAKNNAFIWKKDHDRLPREACVLGVRDWICD